MLSSSLENKIKDKWDDEKILEVMLEILKSRAKVGINFITDEDGLIHGYATTFTSNELMFAGEPVPFGWPLQQLPLPEAFKETSPKRIN